MLWTANLLIAFKLATSSGPSDVDIDRFLAEAQKHVEAPGMSVAVVRNGKVAYAKGFGFADVEKKGGAQAHSVYRLGSVTKQFTATVAMQLIQEGKLRLDDPIRKYVPDLPESWDKATVKNLLNHTSGIHNYTSLPLMRDGTIARPTTPRGIVKTVEDRPLDFEPGSRWDYSNTGYEVLGLIIEKIEGRPLGDSLKARIFGPLHMNETYFTTDARIVRNHAVGYTKRGGAFVAADPIHMSWPYAAGSMESTVLDLAKWDAALYGEKVLPQTALRVMWTPTVLSTGNKSGYGFGWAVTEVNGVQIVGHGGGIPGFTTNIRRAPAHGLTVIVLTNSDHGDADGVAVRLMNFLDPSLKPAPPTAIADEDPATTRLAKETFESILSGTLDRTKLSAPMAKLLTPQFLVGARQQLNATGALKSFTLIAANNEGGSKHRTYAITLGDTTLKLEFTVGASGLIEGMALHE